MQTSLQSVPAASEAHLNLTADTERVCPVNVYLSLYGADVAAVGDGEAGFRARGCVRACMRVVCWPSSQRASVSDPKQLHPPCTDPTS